MRAMGWVAGAILAALASASSAAAQAVPTPLPALEELSDIEALPPPVDAPAAPSMDLPSPGTAHHLSWLHVHYWMPPEIWSGSFELGLNGSEGNAQSLSLRVGGKLKRDTPRDTLSLTWTYAQTSNGERVTQDNALATARQEWKLGDSPWSVVSTSQLEYDAFKQFDLRLVTNLGLGYQWVKTEAFEFKTRLGAGTSAEFGGPDERWAAEADFGFDYAWQLTERQSLTATVDYYPEFGNFGDYRMQANVAYDILLDEATDMHLKLGLIDRFDSTPGDRQANDIDYSLLLLWKL